MTDGYSAYEFLVRHARFIGAEPCGLRAELDPEIPSITRLEQLSQLVTSWTRRGDVAEIVLSRLKGRPRMNGTKSGDRVLIVGAGLAGLAAAAALVLRGYRVQLLESRPRIGGRASSFVDRSTGETIDNCQHVVMGCCTNFFKFLSLTGTRELVSFEPSLTFVGPEGTISDFSANSLPAPLHLAGAFLRLPYLTSRDRISLVLGLRALARYRRNSDDRRSFADWLADHHQTTAAIDGFWSVVLVSALSEQLDRIDVVQARKVFVDGFLANREGWKVAIPACPLEELYGVRVRGWLERQGTEIRLQTAVEQLIAENDRVAAARLRSGETIEADEFILATLQSAVADLLPHGLIDHPTLTRLRHIETAPISSVHLWFDRPILPLPHAVLVGRLSQWIFRRASGPEKRSGLEGAPDLHYYQVVISASSHLEGIPAEGVIAQVVDEIEAIWPEARKARLVHSRLITEHRAVFSPVPGIDALRPHQQTPVANLQLAGDWTRTGWPATMEGAVRSGFLAAENILRRSGRAERILAPDLPVERGARWLFGL